MSEEETRVNKGNFDFYRNIGVENLSDLAQKGGFSEYSDLLQAYPFIKNAGRVLELGAGYGRCVQFLLEEGFGGEIVAIEQSAPFVSHMRKEFEGKATILEGDFMEADLQGPFDAMLWMWSGILDFAPDEQRRALARLCDQLSPGGVITIDTPRIGVLTWGTHSDPQRLSVDSPYGPLECYIPSPDELAAIGKSVGLELVETIDYETATQKTRTLIVLKKK